MPTKQSIFVLFLLLQGTTPLSTVEERVKRNPDLNAFSNDINACLFNAWTTASGNPHAVLSKPVDCGDSKSHSELCYGVHPPTTVFASCYNKETLTPDFTGHIVKPNVEGSGRYDFREDKGPYAPNPQATVTDYDPYDQRHLYDNWDVQKGQFCAKGHLTPNSAFSDDDERELTMITTNIAPQWQLFNSENWAVLEKSVRKCATRTKRDLYVFTGIGGKAQNSKGDIIYLNKRVLTPKYYWKAVCDPIAKQSIVFVSENPVGIISKNKVSGCNNKLQTEALGVVTCMSHEQASKDYQEFKLPPFDDTNCNPSVRGTFMDQDLTGFK